MLLRAGCLVVIGWFLALPLRDVLAYPDRVSVLPNLQTDAEAYYLLGRAIAEARTLDAFPVRHPPGWIALLAAAFTVAGPSFVAGKLISWVALVASVGGCAWLARRMYHPTAGWIAALLCASSPALRWYVGTVQYEVFTGALLLAVVILATRAIESSSSKEMYRRFVWVGLVGSLLILTRETFAVVLPLIGVWMGSRVRTRTTRRAAAAAALSVAAIAIAPAAMWSALQSVRHGAFVTISEKGPIVIELGHNPLANGTYNAPLVGIGQPTGLAYALQNPGREVVLSARKILYFWGVLRDGWNVPRPMAVWLWRASTGLVPLEAIAALARGGWLLLMFLAALWLLGRAGLAHWWGVPATVLLLMMVHIVTLSSHRFAVPALPLVFVLSSGPLGVLTARVHARLRSPAVVAAAAILAIIVVAMQFQPWPLTLRLRASALDGLVADNTIDPIAGHEVRSADAARGVRPIALLSDHYFARGAIRIQLTARRLTAAASPAAPAIRISLVDLDGQAMCGADALSAELASDRFVPIALNCLVATDRVGTLVVFSLGAVDVALDELSLDWVR